MEYTIKVPQSANFASWFRFIDETKSEYYKVDVLTIDFNDVYFLDTNRFVLLACLIEYFYHDDCEVKFIGGTKKLNDHLYNIRFKEYWKKNFNREQFTISYNRSTLCLWKVSKNMIDTYSLYARDYFRRTFLKDKDLLPISHNLAEVFNNIFDHAKSPVHGYVITQFYPIKNKISFSVCDFGVGISKSINNYRKKNNEGVLEDWQAIHKSLENGYSVKSIPQNRGMGLHNILELTEDSNGTLIIISNNGYVEKSAHSLYQMGETNHNFDGTLIKVEVDMSTFDMLDDDEEIFSF